MRAKLTLALFLLSLGTVLFGQEFRSSISGHVVDASGARVPAAKIQATNTATNEVWSATSDGSGGYNIPLLRPGDYRLTATATGFKQYIQGGIVLEAAKVAGIDITLQVGAVTETVEVTAESTQLETQSASRSGVVGTQLVSELPLNARNPFMLGAMMSGVTFNGAAIWQRPFDNGAIAEWSINGSRNSSTEYFLDGASNNGQMGGNNIAYVPIVDAVQEFTVMQNLYNAEFGHTGGGVLNVVMKSGGSRHHGTVSEFMRRTALDANTFQNNSVSTNLDANGKAKRPTHYLDQYGFQVEGPVLIPKLLRKDGPFKLFYMGAFENYREGTPNPLILSYPEAEMRTGDFSKLVNASGVQIPIYDQSTAVYSSNGTATTARAQYPGNKIPVSLLNPVALNVTKFMPLPNRAAPGGSRYSTNNLFLPDYFDVDHYYNLIIKFDFNIGEKNRAYFRHASNDRTEDRSSNGIDNKPGTDGQQPFQRINDAYVADFTRTMNPSTILNVRASYNRFIEKGYGSANTGFDVSSLGVPKSVLNMLPNQDKIYFGKWNVNGYQGLGRGQSNNYTNTYQLQGSLTKVTGSHSMKFGADLRQINYELQNTGDILSFTGSTTWTQNAFSNANSNTGDGYASFLIGGVSGSTNYPLFPWWKQHYGALYANDDWKVSRRLTLNLGFRYDITQGQYEKWNRMNGPFDPTLASPAKTTDAAIIASLTAAGVPASQITNLQNLKGGLTFAGVDGRPRTSNPWPKNNFGPRVGVAYQLHEKIVMRGGIGLYYSNPNNDSQRTSGFSTSTNVNNSVDSGRTLLPNLLTNPFPNGINVPTGSTRGAATFLGQNPSWFDPSFVTPKVLSFSFGFQVQTSKSSNVEVTYVGSRSYDLNMSANYNLMDPAFEKQCNLYRGGSPVFCQQTVPNPFAGNPLFVGQNLYTATTISRSTMAQQFPQFSGTLSRSGLNDAWIRYNSLQVNYNLRMRSGITLVGNYTLSKQVEESNYNDDYSKTLQRGLYLLDRPHILKLTAIYELPFGEGKHIGANSNKVVKTLISGWQWTNFYNHALKGFPSNLPGNVFQLKDPATPGGGFTGTPDWKAYRVRIWNPCVLKQNNDGSIAPTPASITLGCGTDYSNNWGNYAWLQQAPNFSQRVTPFRSGQIRRHQALQLDASLLKTTKISESMRFQFGFEVFNLLNHNYFGRDNVNQTPDDSNGNFGAIFPGLVSTQNMLPRQIQLRFKFNW
jgi:hypothetical protein